MPSSLRSLLIFALLACSSAPCVAQVQTGTPPFSSSGGGAFDTINLANLNAHFTIPVVSRSLRETRLRKKSFAFQLLGVA